MPSFPGVHYRDAIRALEKAGFSITRQGKHAILSNGTRQLIVPRHNPINAITMGNIIRAAGLTQDEFRRLM